MIYLSFTSEIPNKPLGGSGTTRYGNITIKIGDKTYDICTTDTARRENGETKAQYLRDVAAKWPHTVSQEIQSGQKPFYLPIEEDALLTLRSIPITIAILEEYELPIMVGNLNSGYQRQKAFKTVGYISQDVAIELQRLSDEPNGYEVRLHLIDKKIQLTFTPSMVLLDNPKLDLGFNERDIAYTHQRMVSIIEETLQGCDNNILTRLQMAKKTMAVTLGIDWRINKAYADSTFEPMFHRKVQEMRTASASSVATPPRLKSFLIPDMNAGKKSLIESLGGIVLTPVGMNPAKIQIDSNQLKKEPRTELGIERFKFTFPNQKIKRLQYLEQHCDATVEPEADGKYLVTFPAQHMELVELVAKHWEELQEPISQSQAVQECKR